MKKLVKRRKIYQYFKYKKKLTRVKPWLNKFIYLVMDKTIKDWSYQKINNIINWIISTEVQITTDWPKKKTII